LLNVDSIIFCFLSITFCIASLICFFLYLAYQFWTNQDIGIQNERHYRVADYWFGMIEYLFLRFSECLNPLFYNFGSNKMRKHSIMFLKQKVFCFVECKKRKRNDVTSESIEGMRHSKSTTNLRIWNQFLVSKS